MAMNEPQDCPDTLLLPSWVVTVDEADRVLPGHAVAVRDGIIAAILPGEEAQRRWPDAETVDLTGHALMPGMVNAHTHAAMSLLRGLADDLPLMQWLQEHIWPAEGRWVDESFVHDGSGLAFAEMLRGGTTCLNDMYFFPEVTARLAEEIGMRAVVGMIVLDFPTQYADGPDQYFEKGLALHDRYRSNAMIHTAFAPHAPYTVSDEPLERVRMYADELDVPIQMHVQETRGECDRAMADHGERPLARLERLGLLSPGFAAVHMTVAEDDEIEAFARTGASVIHCPESNLKLASGFAPVQRLQKAGINVALGTDGAASNNDLDMFGEMRTAALIAKAVAEDAEAVPADVALRMATINGARAIGLGEVTGSIEEGKAADLVAVDLTPLETRPIYDVVSQLVYATGRHQVSDVWIAGRPQVRNGQLVTLDPDDLANRTAAWQERIGGAR
ncbi:TRZ/ATZ family hydrolase [Halofilum ochraceum]|uniref:TRZ/ATZ family hydrolase n=1 Tax=Halofilum ochraceum TaxID=1611323 RepID=UPI001FDEA8DB|nr:TRZ/ATZ family hydrolase [Halofilum ochraceum]